MSAHLTQDTLGRRSGIVGKYVSEIERGTRDIPFSTLHAIVESGLGLQLDIGFRAKGPMRQPLPRAVEELARTIAALTDDERVLILAIVRSALKLAT